MKGKPYPEVEHLIVKFDMPLKSFIHILTFPREPLSYRGRDVIPIFEENQGSITQLRKTPFGFF